MKDSRLKLLIARVGPFVRLDTASRPLQAVAWSIDDRSGCAVALRSPFSSGGEAHSMTVNWSGTCICGKATGPGVVRWSKEGRTLLEFEGRLVDGALQGPGRCRDADLPAWKARRFDDGLRKKQE